MIGILGGALIFGSCQKKLDEAYQNPNQPVVVPIEQIFPSVIGSMLGSSSASGSGYGLGGDGINVGRYVQYWANYALTTSVNGGTQFDQMGGVISSSDAFGSVWGAFYFGMGQNLNRIVDWGTAQKKWDYVGGARALRGWGWLELANQYADAIIVRQAFNTSLQTFNYDPMQLAYDSCRQACYDALNYLNMTGDNVSQTNFAKGDMYFLNGDVNKWKKFTYGILARSFAYLSNKADYKADSVIKYANLAMSSNTDNALLTFAATTGVSGTASYFGPYRGNVGSLRQSAFICDLMSGRNSAIFTGVTDPRTWYMLRENSDSTFYGVTPNTDPTSLLTSNLRPQNFWGNSFSSVASPTIEAGRYIFRNSAPYPVMTASEMQFLIAEASYKKGDKSTALTAYSNAISLNFDMLSNTYATGVPSSRQITSLNKQNYLSNPAIVPTSSQNLTLSMIMMQKFIALYGWGSQETWCDMRRYHYTGTDPISGMTVYPGFVPAGGNLYIDNNGKYVYRVRPRYNSEYLYDIPSLISVGALSASGSQVPDYHTKESWFSQQ